MHEEGERRRGGHVILNEVSCVALGKELTAPILNLTLGCVWNSEPSAVPLHSVSPARIFLGVVTFVREEGGACQMSCKTPNLVGLRLEGFTGLSRLPTNQD